MKHVDKPEPQPLKVTFGDTKPAPHDIDWRAVCHVEVYGRLDERGKAIVDAALTNRVNRVHIKHMDAEAQYSVDHFVT